jgi:hypothetical protein
MAKIQKIMTEKKPVILESDGNYTTCTFEDGSKEVLSYCQTAIERRFGVKLKGVKRGVSVDPEYVKVMPSGVEVLGRVFNFSRRMNWNVLRETPSMASVLAFFMLLGFSSGFAQAPVANADVVYDCKARPIIFNLLANDVNASGTSIVDMSFPTSGGISLISGNRIRYTWGGSDSTQFTYRLKTPANVYSNTTTVKIYGRNVWNFSGDYTDSANLLLKGCRMVNSGKFTIKATAKVRLESNTSVLLLPGTLIESGAVVELKIVRP